MNRSVERLIQKFGNEPESIQIERKQMTVESIEQICFEVRQRSRIELTSRIIDLEQPKLTIIFCNTKRSVDECTEALLARGYSVDRLHGDIAQTMRERVLRMFREGTVEVLVATDVAARGIDVDDVDLVINYELPQDPEDYVHRVGRTGRAGREGKAVSFIYGRDAYRIRTIEKYTRQQIQKVEVPTQDEVDSHLQDQLLSSIAERLSEDKTNEERVEFLQPLRELEHEWEDIASALLEMVKELTAREGERIIEDDPEASRQRDRRDDSQRDRKERRERRPRDRRDDSRGPEEGMVQLFLSLGKRDRINPGDIVGMLHNECNLERGSVGRIRLMPNFTLIEVREDSVDQAIEMASNATLRETALKSIVIVVPAKVVVAAADSEEEKAEEMTVVPEAEGTLVTDVLMTVDLAEAIPVAGVLMTDDLEEDVPTGGVKVVGDLTVAVETTVVRTADGVIVIDLVQSPNTPASLSPR